MKGYSLEFSSFPVQYAVRETKLNAAEAVALDKELSKLIDKGVVEKLHTLLVNISPLCFYVQKRMVIID